MTALHAGFPPTNPVTTIVVFPPVSDPESRAYPSVNGHVRARAENHAYSSESQHPSESDGANARSRRPRSQRGEAGRRSIEIEDHQSQP
ncbi:hypothetical protein [Haladaptatus sp. CMAA 1911]|uniref:hypothetical protein n=1 Tax=unclassified Haladaptatus TaxID=2622732 RepID=UPI00375412FF